jgi:hypothetical protein
MQEHPGFERFWFGLMYELWLPQCVSSWSFGTGYTGSWFSAAFAGETIVCTSPGGLETEIGRGDMAEYFELLLCMANVESKDVKKMSVEELHVALRKLCVCGDEDKTAFIVSLFHRFY